MTKSIVFTGGGSRGIAYIGSLLKLKGIQEYDTCIGTSIGAMFALVCSISLDIKELHDYIMKKDFNNLYDVHFMMFFNNYGFESTKKFMKLFEDILKLKDINKNITFKELFNKTNKHLIITATNLNKYETIYFDHVNYPDVKVLFAIRCSINIPILFHSIQFEGSYMADGSMTDDFPINPLNKDKTPILLPDSEITCLRLASHPEMNIPVKFSIPSFDAYIYHTMFCLMTTRSDSIFSLRKNNNPNCHTITINTGDFMTANFSIDNEMKEKLINIGKDAI